MALAYSWRVRFASTLCCVALAYACGPGVDLAARPCQKLACNDAPPTACREDQTLHRFENPGRCRLETGQCEYREVVELCPAGCANPQRCNMPGDVLFSRSLLAWHLVTLDAERWLTATYDALVILNRAGQTVRTLPFPAEIAGEPVSELAATPSGAIVVRTVGHYDSGDERVVLLNDSGELLWLETQPHPGIMGKGNEKLSIDLDDTVYFAGRSSLVAIEANGHVRFRLPYALAPLIIALRSGVALVACDVACRGYNPIDGALLWQQPATGQAEFVIFDDAGEVVVTSGKTLTKLDAAAGTVLTTLELAPTAVHVANYALLTDHAGGLVVGLSTRNSDFVYSQSLLRIRQADLQIILERDTTQEDWIYPSVVTAAGSSYGIGYCSGTTPNTEIQCLAALDVNFAPTWQVLTDDGENGAGSVSEPMLDEQGNVWIASVWTGVMKVVALEPLADSSWPQVRADNRNAGRAR